MQPFVFNTVPQLICRPGSALDLAESCQRLGIRQPLLVTDPGLMAIGLVQPVQAALEAAGVPVVLYDQVREDPPEATVEAAAALGRAAAVDGVIALGGGSSMDVAKVVAALMAGSQPLQSLYGVDQISGGRLPLILVPTTAGTGSEVTPVAVITTGETTKAGVSCAVLLPDVALLDADLTLGLPPRVTAMTGVDAMVHAIEAYTSKLKKNPVSDNLAREALRLLATHIRTAVSDGGNREARAAMLLGACLAGQAFANAPVAAVHALAYPLGGHYHIPHGLSNSLVLPAVLAYNMPAAEALYAELAEIVAPNATGSVSARAAALVEALQQLIADVGLPATLAEAGVPAADLPMLAADAMQQQRLLVNNPREVSEADALAIYRAAHGVSA
ncbi:iron-containing alcohol dehydrogenase [Haliea sp.]|jgi:alcohol dehydrogenase class IV|uniref:iron-containing alcohol dehydrogenase n=1 Tax=Haliea TaxID=475794 RepID=UPI000C52E0A1|nr:iron-containing alcohol dehydrogenase [Haliea sp.]MAD64555.1 alcohol dehydrogenase [Haliea sp.]MAY93053.1 alcohol dehydrogenase [Haliea sp.]MBK39744.1 alcohol dehydrogenase [Haliea sp.]MBP69463.1 alcohol dehydrogenase [Haliea sp.]|tara:strand:+ start:2046 stop:3209 length:1164 start_codon:yes stop_codon:yes gene_type:complete